MSALKSYKRPKTCAGCGATPLAWHRVKLGSGWQWRLWPAVKAGALYTADLSQPMHPCVTKPDAAPETEPETPKPQAPAPEPAPVPVHAHAGAQVAAAGGDLAALIAAAVQPLLPPPGPAPLDADAVRSIVSEMLDRDAEKIRERIAELVAAVKPAKTETVITIKNAAGAVTLTGGHTHRDFPRLLSLCAARVPVILIGKPGGSKSHTAQQIAKALDRPYRELVLGPTDTGSKVQGFNDAQGRVVSTEFREAWINGGVLMIEEMDNASAAILTTLNAAFANGHCTFPDGRHPRHADFVLIGCANTNLRGGDASHAQRRPLDAATVDRFVRLVWPYDEDLEERLTLEINPAAGPWLAWVRCARKYAEANYPGLVVSPRASLNGARLLKIGGFSLEEIADGTVFLGGCDKATRDRVLAACPLPAAKAQAA